MAIISSATAVAALGTVLLMAGAAHAATATVTCEASKLKIAGRYGLCRLQADARAVKRGDLPEYAQCDQTFLRKWSTAERKAGGQCPGNGDERTFEAFIIQSANELATAVAGAGPLPACGLLKTGQTTAYGTGSDGDLQKGRSRSYTDNGDGTITDNTTGLMWEKKDQSGGTHDWSNAYTWSAPSTFTTNFMDGTITTTFLASPNSGSGFAGYTD